MAEDLSLGDFLHSVLQDLPTGSHQGVNSTARGSWTPRDIMDFGQDLTTGFMDTDLASMNVNDWDAWLSPGFALRHTTSMSDISTPSFDDSIEMGSAAFRRSAWKWIPNHEKGGESQKSLATYGQDNREGHSHTRNRKFAFQRLESKARDRIVGMLLCVCDKSNFERIMSSFPTAAVLDALINDYLVSLDCGIQSWIHVPTLDLNESMPELLALMAASGATLSPLAEVQRFGYSLNEMCRLAIPAMFERDNSNTRKLQALQAYALSLDIGLWSGDKRTMEIAESHSLPLVTMLRRSNRFRRSRMPSAWPNQHDTQDILDQKWRTWVDNESFKRLAYHVAIHCGQASIALQTPPLISYAEITLDLPASVASWRAQSAQEWQDCCCAAQGNAQLPSFVQCLCSVEHLGLIRESIDIDMALYVVLIGHWCMVYEYRQLDSTVKAQVSDNPAWNAALLASSKCRELRQLLDNSQAAVDDWAVQVPWEVQMLAELVRMNLCVPFEDLQLLAGKEGNEEARRVYPSLKLWYQSADARQAMWHAGQILRAARQSFRTDTAKRTNGYSLRDFHTVAIYHAGLAFWVYGLLSRTGPQEYDAWPTADVATGSILAGQRMSITQHTATFSLNSSPPVSTLDRNRYVALNKSMPVLSVTQRRAEAGNENSAEATNSLFARSKTDEILLPLHESGRVMEQVIEIIKASVDPIGCCNDSRSTRLPAMAETLCTLLNDLGSATSVLR